MTPATVAPEQAVDRALGERIRELAAWARDIRDQAPSLTGMESAEALAYADVLREMRASVRDVLRGIYQLDGAAGDAPTHDFVHALTEYSTALWEALSLAKNVAKHGSARGAA